jgi:hypothetical protein
MQVDSGALASSGGARGIKFAGNREGSLQSPGGLRCFDGMLGRDQAEGKAQESPTILNPSPSRCLARFYFDANRFQAHGFHLCQLGGPHMGKTTKTAAELEAMILSKMQTLKQCPDGMTVTVKRRGETWEALMMSPNNIAYGDCVARVTRYAAVLRTEVACSSRRLRA